MDSDAVVAPPQVAGPLRLEPFRGITLAAHRVGDPASARAFARPYHSVPQRLAAWEAAGTLRHDDTPAIYLHEYQDGPTAVRGLVGALDVSRRATSVADRVIHPHEGIHPAQAEELADRMQTMALNPAPILLVHRAPRAVREISATVRRRVPEHQFIDRSGQHHRLWAIRDPDELQQLQDGLSRTQAMVADGHHRFAAYLRLQDQQPGTAVDLGLAMLVDQSDTPLRLGAIHRVLIGVDVPTILETAARVGIRAEEVGAVDRDCAEMLVEPGTAVVADAAQAVKLTVPTSGNTLPVEEIHHRLLAALPRPPRRIEHHHRVGDAWKQLSGAKRVAILLPAPELDELLEVVTAGRLLPEKATSFQPKPHVGVLIRSLHDG